MTYFLISDEVIRDTDLAIIARDHLSNWENLHPFLELSPACMMEIFRSCPRDYREQKCKCLRVWKEEMGSRATYRALIFAAEEANNKQLADNVRDMLKE